MKAGAPSEYFVREVLYYLRCLLFLPPLKRGHLRWWPKPELLKTHYLGVIPLFWEKQFIFCDRKRPGNGTECLPPPTRSGI